MISLQQPVSVAARILPPASEYLWRNSSTFLYPARAGCRRPRTHASLASAGINARPGSFTICAASRVQSCQRSVADPLGDGQVDFDHVDARSHQSADVGSGLIDGTDEGAFRREDGIVHHLHYTF